MEGGGPPQMGEEIQIPATWVGIDETTVIFANQFIIQFNGNEFFLTAGQMSPPVVVGTPEEIREQLKRLPFLPVRVVSRLAFTSETMGLLVGILQENLAKQKAATKEAKP